MNLFNKLIKLYNSSEASAAGSIGDALQNTYNSQVLPELKKIAGIGFSLATLVVFIMLLFSLITVGIKHNRGMEQDIPWMKWGLLFIGLIIGTTVSLWGWGIIGV